MDSTASAADGAALEEFGRTIIPLNEVADAVALPRPGNALAGAIRRGLPVTLTPLSLEGDESRGFVAGATYLIASREPDALEGAAKFVTDHQREALVIATTIIRPERRVTVELDGEEVMAALRRLLAKAGTGDAAPKAGAAAENDTTSASGEEQTSTLAATLDAIATFLRRYIVFAADAQLVAVVLWTAHTHAIGGFDVSPYLGITSAEKGSGKSRLLELLEMLVARAWRMVSPTEAVVFRKVTRDQPTLLLDEGDATFAQVPEGLRGLLNAGHRRGTTVTRCVGENGKYDLADFQVFCPKAIAAIGELPGTIADRSIPIRLRRRTRGEAVERFRFHDAQAAAASPRQALEAWASEAIPALRAAQPVVPEALNDRAAEGWEPLLAIADLAGGEWPERARAAALALHAHNRDEDSLGVQLLRAIRAVFCERNLLSNRGLFTTDLLNALDAREGEPWHDALRIDLFRDPTMRGSAARLARLLRPYAIQPRDARNGEKVAKGYRVADFTDAFARLLGE